jgi:hypothetical protein
MPGAGAPAIGSNAMNEQPTSSEGGEAQPLPPPSPLRDSVSNATQRIHAIIDAAEKAASGIIEDAEAQARRYLEESRRRGERLAEERAREISEVTDSLIERAESVKRQADALIAALGAARHQLEERPREDPASMPASGDSPPEGAQRTPAPHLKPVEPLAAPRGEAPGPEPAASGAVAGEPTAGARLLATQMAVAGSSRPEIENRLRSEFGIEDAGPMLDAILGPKP